jgi:MtrB/PioB family decaheme-associated outer membrane protein
MKTRLGFLWLSFLFSVFLLPSGASAQLLDLKLSGEGEAGGRGFPDRSSESDRAKFGEYRDIPSGGFLEDLRLQLESKDETYSLELGAREPGEKDQNFFLRSSKAGRYYFLFEWDQLPHVFSNNGRSLFSGTGGGNLRVSDTVQSDLEAASVAPDTAAIRTIINENVRDIDLQMRQDVARTGFRYTPLPEWDFRLGYSLTQKKGSRPFGANTRTNNTSPFNTVEIPEPIDYQTHDITAGAEYASDWGSIGLNYTGSIFGNDNASVTWDNPFRTTDSATLGPARGRHALSPDNVAHSVALNGALNLPWASRLMGTVSYGWMRQDESFLPMTTNLLLTPSPLPASSLDGRIDTLLANFALNTRLLRDVSMTARYRFYLVNNKTSELTFLDYVTADGGVTGAGATAPDRRALALEYNRHNAGLDLGWRPLRMLSLKAGYGWERYDRDRRDADVTNEHSGKFSADLTPIDWLLLRASYLFAARRYDKYDHEHFVGDPTFADNPPSGLHMHENLRKFDMANRDRNKVDLLAQLMPLDSLTFTTSFGFGNDDFKNVGFGITGDDNWNVGADVVYVPVPDVALYANYMHENFKSKMRSRQRGGSQGDSADYDWGSKWRDIVDTVGAGVDLALIPKKLDLRLGYGFSTATGEVKTRALGANPAPSITAVNFPDTKSRLHELTTRLSLHLTKSVTAKLTYIYERWTDKDFTQDPMQPYMQGVDGGASRSVFLGATRPNYGVHIIGLSFRFRF